MILSKTVSYKQQSEEGNIRLGKFILCLAYFVSLINTLFVCYFFPEPWWPRICMSSTFFPFFSWWPFPLKLRSFFIPLSTVYVNFVVLWFLSRTSIFFSSTSQLDQVWHSSVHPDGQFEGDVKFRMNFSNVDTVFPLRS